MEFEFEIRLMKKIIFFILWTLTILLVPVTILKVTPLNIALSEQKLLINFLQRFVGLLAFTLLFWQIILGAFMEKWIEKLGGWIFKFHVTEGAIAYALVILHPLLFILFNFKAFGKLDPFYVFTDICLLCPNKLELFYTLGRISFWLVTVAVIVAKFRTWGWLRIYWRKFHILNYIGFLLAALHGGMVGTDLRLHFPLPLLYSVAVSVVAIILFYKFYILVLKK